MKRWLVKILTFFIFTGWVSAEIQPVQLCFLTGDDTSVYVTRTIDIPTGTDVAGQVKLILTVLGNGLTPSELLQEYYTAIPVGTKIQAINIETNKITVDFNTKIISAGMDDVKLSEIYRQVIDTLKVRFPFDSFNLTVNGKSLGSYIQQLNPLTP